MATQRYYYSASFDAFLRSPVTEILGVLTSNYEFDLSQSQRDAWLEEMEVLRSSLDGLQGWIYFEYAVPRMGKRIDVVLLIEAVILVLEFKVGETEFASHAVDQVWDYALDLKNFHAASYKHWIAPLLIATRAKHGASHIAESPHKDRLLSPIQANTALLGNLIREISLTFTGDAIDPKQWEAGGYCPTPTIIEAAMALYNGHAVTDISRSDATARNLTTTSEAIAAIIGWAKTNGRKAICFVTGVPGAGKTLVGLNIATKHMDKSSDLYSVFLSGNGPLVEILREALARDTIRRAKESGSRLKKGQAMSEVKVFIQNVHHFRDDCLADPKPPLEHVVLFDEAQRAWNLEQTAHFMRRKKKNRNWKLSEPEFLISCLDRHLDWAVIVCLVGGGQEINTGEAGIGEWIRSLNRSFKGWNIFLSPKLADSEYQTEEILRATSGMKIVRKEELHLSVSMRSFRSEKVSLLVRQILDLEQQEARRTLASVKDRYPIVITRELGKAKKWLRDQARGSERYGIVVSSQAERLRPHAINVKGSVNPVHWFLDGKDDVRSSYFLEDVATEFHIQGLELDWACVAWDADFRYTEMGWEHWSFVGTRWKRIKKQERQNYLKNAYRVLLTRARQGMVIVVPEGDESDATRKVQFYDPTFNYLRGIGLESI